MKMIRLLITIQLISVHPFAFAQMNTNTPYSSGNQTVNATTGNQNLGNQSLGNQQNGNKPVGGPNNNNGIINALPVSMGCPYETKSADAKLLIESTTQNLDKLIDQLSKDGGNCKIPPQVQTDFSSFSTAIKELGEKQYPAQKDMGGILTVGNSAFTCSATHQPLYSFLTTYVSDRIVQLSSVNSAPAGISGPLGNSVESSIKECMKSAPTVTKMDAETQTKIEQCVNDSLKFNPNQPSNPGSIIDTYYRTACIGDNAKIYEDQFVEQNEKLQNDKMEFEKKLTLIAQTAGSLTSSLANTGNKCADVKVALNTAIQKGINLAGALSGPWGILAASTLTPLVNQTMGMIGTHQREIKKLTKMKDSFYEDDFRDRFSCNIFHANKLKCEYFNRISSAFATKDSTCEKSLVDEQSMRDIISLGKAIQEKNEKKKNSQSSEINTQSSPKTDEKMTPRQADELYEKIFVQKLQINGQDRTPYDILFQGQNGLISKVLANQEVLKKQGQGKQKAVEKDMVREMNELKSNLDTFKKVYEQEEKSKDESYLAGVKTIQNLTSGSYNLALISYMKMAAEKGEKQKSPDFLIDGPLSKELSEQMINQAMDVLSTEVPTNLDETADLTRSLNLFYEQFLIKDEIRKDYILDPTVANLKKLSGELKSHAKFENKKLKDASANLTSYLYPMFRDCVMNYQAGLEPQSDGKFKLSSDYQKSCAFLKSCGTNNTINLPFDLSSSEQADPKATNAKDFKACSIAYNFDVMANKFKDEVLKENKICGTPIEEAIGNLPAN